MIKTLKVLIIQVLLCLPMAVNGAERTNEANVSVKNVDWTPVMEAIIQVESGGNAKAKSGNSCGAMQITPILVAECNNILKSRKSKKRYTLADRYNVEKSKEMFLLIQSFHNPESNVEKAIRSWNGGMRYSTRRTQGYYNKVMKHLR